MLLTKWSLEFTLPSVENFEEFESEVQSILNCAGLFFSYSHNDLLDLEETLDYHGWKLENK